MIDDSYNDLIFTVINKSNHSFYRSPPSPSIRPRAISQGLEASRFLRVD